MMMKKEYKEPKIEVIVISVNEIIVTSGFGQTSMAGEEEEYFEDLFK